MKHVTWNLLEASHGKGPADGIGDAVKTAADRLVANGSDVLSCGQMMESLENTFKVQLNEITSEQIDAVVEKVSGSCPVDAINGTMQIHQLMVPSRAALYHRKLSCYCADTSADGTIPGSTLPSQALMLLCRYIS